MPAFEIVALDEATPQLRAPGSADTYLAPRALAITPVALTGSAATSSLSIAQTWNTSGTPTAFDLNVTDTASNAASLLMNVRRGGNSVMSVTKAVVNVGDPTAFYNSPVLNLRVGSGTAIIGANGVGSAAIADSFGIETVGGFGFRSAIGSGADVLLRRDAANTLALRNGTAAQTLNVYNTFTDASNYERGVASWGVVGNFLTIGTQNAGTGTARGLIISAANADLRFYNTGLTNSVQFTGEVFQPLPTSGTYHLGSGANNWKAIYMGERASAPTTPPTNGVVFYAEDNGGGKTRLMARFATGAAQQIAIEP